MSNNLVIFDIDGTLTNTVCMDSDIFLNAFMNHLNINELNSNWYEYKYSTDSGFALEIFENHVGRLPADEEIDVIKEDFFNSLLSKITQNPASCDPVSGAETIFNEVLKTQRWDTAIATGGWEKSALMKLKYASIDYQNSPVASSDDHIERHEIIKVAIERSKQHYNKKLYDYVVYIGDRHWDYKAAQELGIGFIGIGDELRKAQLKEPIIDNYINGSLVSLLNSYAATYF